MRTPVLLGALTALAVVPSELWAQNTGIPPVPVAELIAEAVDDFPPPGLRIPTIGQVAGVVVLNRHAVAVADGASGAIHFINLNDPLVSTDVPEALDPLDTPIRFLDRLPGDRLVAWRSGDGDFLKVYTSEGELEDSIRWGHAQAFGGPRPVGILPDRTLILRSNGLRPSIPGVPDLGSASPSGLIRYEAQGDHGSVVVAEAAIGDYATVTVPNGAGTSFLRTRMIFGDQVLAVRSGTHLVVAETDATAVLAYNRDGSLAYSIPIPGTRVSVGDAHVTAQRYRRIAEARARGGSRRQVDLIAAAAEYAGKEWVAVNTDSLAILQLPAQDTVPSIDQLLGDAWGRVWIRLTPLPADNEKQWCVWDSSRQEYVFSLALPRELSLLGAFPDTLLLLQGGGSNRPRLLMAPFAIVGVSGHSTLPPDSPCQKG